VSGAAAAARGADAPHLELLLLLAGTGAVRAAAAGEIRALAARSDPDLLLAALRRRRLLALLGTRLHAGRRGRGARHRGERGGSGPRP
jgi:hypothetical protein